MTTTQPAGPKPVAIVTGASSGIGRATAIRLAGHGYTVVLVARRAHELAAVKDAIKAAGGSALAVQADLTKLKEILHVVEEARVLSGRIDVLVNVAGIGKMHSILTDDADLERMVQTNLLAPIRFMRLIVPIMRAQRSGAIVNIGSVAGEIGVNGLYSATKFGLRGITDSVRREVAGSGIHVSLIEPGYIDTPLMAGSDQRMPGPEIVVDAIETCLIRTRRRVVLPFKYRLAVLANTLFPWLTDRYYAGRAAQRAPGA
jgi:NAD(P)-dependent dehydrogenase (short-subunit alcohol dehydrogenase family)